MPDFTDLSPQQLDQLIAYFSYLKDSKTQAKRKQLKDLGYSKPNAPRKTSSRFEFCPQYAVCKVSIKVPRVVRDLP